MTKMNAQQLGSATTYLRRQTYSLVGLAPDEDDDGNEVAKVGGFNHRPEPDTSTVDPLVVNRYCSRAQDIKDADYTDEQIDEAIFHLHEELNSLHDAELYTAVAEALSKRGIITKANWKLAVTAHKKRMKDAA
jgi:hypothetical protein